jgi:hypothetical protein
MGETRNAYRILVGKPEGKRPLGRPRRRWVVNIKMDLKRDRMGWYALDRTGSGQGPVEGSCEHGDEPSGSLKLGPDLRGSDRARSPWASTKEKRDPQILLRR